MRRITCAVFAVGLLAATMTAPASAKVDRIPVSTQSYPTSVVFDWGDWWMSGSSEHVRGQSFEMRVDGTGAEGNEYMDGYIIFDSFNSNINCGTGIGNVWTTFTWTSDLDENSGWFGTSTGHYSGYACGWPPNWDYTLESRVVATGFGQFQGLQLRYEDVYDGDFPYHYGEGYVKVLP